MHTKLQYFCSTFVPDKVKYGHFCYIWYLTEKWQRLAGTTRFNEGGIFFEWFDIEIFSCVELEKLFKITAICLSARAI